MTNPYAPPRASVFDVQDPLATLVLADRGTRLGAALLDGIIFGAMVYLPVFITLLMVGAIGSAGRIDTRGAFGPAALVGFMIALGGFAAWCWLTIRNILANGQTIAKKMLGIKVVRSDGSAISLSRIFWMRNVLNSVIGVVPLIGFIYALADLLFIFSESRQCLHDKLADTIVVVA